MKPNAVLPDEIQLTKPEVEKEKKEHTKKEEKPQKKPALDNKQEAKPVEKETSIKELTNIPGVGPSIVKKFEKAGVKTLEEVFDMDAEEISEIEGIGIKTAETIIKELKFDELIAYGEQVAEELKKKEEELEKKSEEAKS